MLAPFSQSKTMTQVLRPSFLAAAVGLVSIAGFPRASQAVGPAADLIAAINQYRQQQGLPAIAASPKLNAVAVAHAQDVTAYHPESKCGGNLHSWSANGPWKGGCYNPQDQSTWPIMWNKPQEIAGYPSYGYEIAAAGVTSAQDALNMWKASAPHNAVILNQGMWAGYQWKAMGAACYGGYACVWFGTDADASQPPTLMLAKPLNKTTVHGQATLKNIPWGRVKRMQ
jgi:hypothetical protein